MKVRLKTTSWGVLIACDEYPKCKCKGHYVWESNKKLKAEEKKDDDK